MNDDQDPSGQLALRGPVIDTMIDFPQADFSRYDFIRAQTKDAQSNEEYDFPVEYMFKNVPKELYGVDADPIDVTLGEMDRFNVAVGLVGCNEETGREAVRRHPDRFAGAFSIDANDVLGQIRRVRALHDEIGLKALSSFPSGCLPPVPIDDAKMYPFYALACELDLPIFVCAGVPGPRIPMDAQRVERVDQVMYDFPELTLVLRHGCEPWQDLAVKLMLKWPGLHYSTSAFAPKHYPQAIIDYANTRGADKIIYAGYFPMGLSLSRIFADLADVPFKDEVWPKFLYGNAARILRLGD